MAPRARPWAIFCGSPPVSRCWRFSIAGMSSISARSAFSWRGRTFLPWRSPLRSPTSRSKRCAGISSCARKEFDLRLWRTTRVLAASMFFANFLPGAAGGDLIRGVYVYRSAPGRRTAAMLSILIDRLIGLVAFVLLGLAAVFTRPVAAGPLEITVIGVSLAFIALLVLLFFYGHVIADRLQRLLSGRSARLARIVDDTGTALRQYARDWRSTGLAMLLSVAIVGLALAPLVLIAEAMPFTGPSAGDYAIAGLYALIANSLPITPGGLGIGEGAFASVCVAAGAAGGARRLRHHIPGVSLRLHPLDPAGPCRLSARPLSPSLNPSLTIIRLGLADVRFHSPLRDRLFRNHRRPARRYRCAGAGCAHQHPRGRAEPALHPAGRSGHRARDPARASRRDRGERR